MTELKITIDQLKNYLGTGLKINPIHVPIQHQYYTRHELDLSVMYNCRLDQIKPICYRLSDLDKFIPELGFVPLKELFPQWKWDEETESEQWFVDEDLKMKSAAYQLLKGPTLTFDRVQKLFQWHFWPFGEEYFEQGLVIDKMLSSN